MVRSALTAALRGALRLFFRRIEVVGRERVPPTGPTLFAINHPNGLIDPLLLLCFAPRPVSFLGKAPLFRMPVIGWLARTFDSIPVHRRQEGGTDPARNQETFARARALLERGGTLAIAPEGTSHSDPKLRPIKTGAARIALGAATGTPVAIVPVGLFYTEKAVFRSSALIVFGEAIRGPATGTAPTGEPAPEEVNRLTAAIEIGLASLVPQADDHDAHQLVTRAERLLTAALPDPRARTLDDRLVVRQRLLAGYRTLRDREPVLLDRLIRRVDRLDRAFQTAGLSPDALPSTPPRVAAIPRALGRLLVRVGGFVPLAVPGVVIHYPAYRLIGWVARVVAGEHDDVLATVKIIAAALFYPVTWVAVGAAVGWWLGWPFGVGAALLAPLSGYAALRLVERFGRFLSATRALGFYLFEPEHFGRLAAEREALRHDLLALADRLGAGAETASR